MTFNTGKLLFVFVPVAGLLFASCPRLKCGMGRGRFTVLMVKVVLEMSATGVWKDTVGTVQKIDVSRQTVTINVEMFGRETPVEINFSDVKKL